MKIITISKIGYNTPSQANWSYGIWKVDLIDTDTIYNMSYTLTEKFGGDSRFRKTIKDRFNIEVLETKGVYTSTGTQKITGIKSLMDIEDVKFIDIISEFLNK